MWLRAQEVGWPYSIGKFFTITLSKGYFPVWPSYCSLFFLLLSFGRGKFLRVYFLNSWENALLSDSQVFEFLLSIDQIVPSIWSLNCSPTSDLPDHVERYSRKVFVGGLPPDIDEGKKHDKFCLILHSQLLLKCFKLYSQSLVLLQWCA